MKKALVGESKKDEMKNRQLQLEKENRDLASQIEELENIIKRTEIVNALEREDFKRTLNADKLEFRKSIFKLQENLQTKLEQMIA
jgi:hypothetical protein